MSLKISRQHTWKLLNIYKYNEEGVRCLHCKVEFTQPHCEICPARASLREGLDINQWMI